MARPYQMYCQAVPWQNHANKGASTIYDLFGFVSRKLTTTIS